MGPNTNGNGGILKMPEDTDARFDQLLEAMAKRPPLGEGKKPRASPASIEADAVSSDEIRTPKGRSGATSSKRTRKSRS